MAFAYSADIQDQVALRVSGRSYSALSTDQKKIIDGGATPPTVTFGAVADAISVIGKWAAFLTMDPSDGIPEEWAGWIVMLSALKCAGRFTTADDDELRRNEAMAREDALRTYQRSDIDSTVDTAHLGSAIIEIRRFVVSSCMMMDRPILPTPENIDAATQEILHEVWDMSNWSFRREPVTLTIGTDSSVTVSPSVNIDRLAIDTIVYTDGANADGGEAREASAETMTRLLARSLSAGKPQYFRLIDSDNGVTWVFDRTPDQSYTAKTEVIKEIGALTTPTEMQTAAGLFPKKFLPYLRKRILATTLENSGHPEARSIEVEAAKYEEQLAHFDSPRSEDETDEELPSEYGIGFYPGNGVVGGWL